MVRIGGERGRPLLLNDLCFTLKAGEILGMTGPSGAGKSLTALSICGLLDPPLAWTGGRIVIDSHTITPNTPQRWRAQRGRGVFLIFQSAASALNPRLKIALQIGEALREVRGMTAADARDEIPRLLERVDLAADVVELYPFQLSGGMRQRVLIAIALGLRPKVVVADEPTSGLDPVRQAEVVQALRRLPEDLGAGLLVLSHDLRLLRRLAGRVGVIYEGRLVELQNTQQLLSRPGHPWTAAMVQSLCLLSIADATSD